MATFDVRFLGCKVSHADAQALRERLLADGHEERGGGAEIAIINTCCVTNEAVAKSRQAASRAARSHRRVYVTGCAREPRGRRRFATLPSNVVGDPGALARSCPRSSRGDVGAIGCVQADARLDRVRAFVKVQDGCSFACNFCVIPLVRGPSRSRRAAAVLAEIEKRVRQGHREVVLTGINLGCFRDREAGFRLADLIRAAGSTAGLERLRLSSIEINHVNEELVAALRETPAVCASPPRPAAVRRRRDPARDGPALHGRGVPAPPRAARRLQPHGGRRSSASPARTSAAFRNTLDVVRRARHHEGSRVPVLAAAGHGHRR